MALVKFTTDSGASALVRRLRSNGVLGKEYRAPCCRVSRLYGGGNVTSVGKAMSYSEEEQRANVEHLRRTAVSCGATRPCAICKMSEKNSVHRVRSQFGYHKYQVAERASRAHIELPAHLVDSNGDTYPGKLVFELTAEQAEKLGLVKVVPSQPFKFEINEEAE